MTAAPTAIDTLPIGAMPIGAGVASFPAAAAPWRPGQPITLSGRVLLAEDGLENQQIISLFLRKAGADVVIAENGRVAIERVNSHPLDLILMDIEMPELDGYAATGQLRASGCTLPIIALTAHSAADDQQKCLAAGCTDYMAKPVERSTLLVSVAGYLSGGRPGNAVSVPAAIPRQASAPGETLKSSFADEPAMVAAIAEFVDLLPYRVGIMQRLLAEDNLSELRRVVHQIKGAGGGYGFDDITQFAAQADRMLKQENRPETIEREIDLLIALIRSVEGYQPSRERFHV